MNFSPGSKIGLNKNNIPSKKLGTECLLVFSVICMFFLGCRGDNSTEIILRNFNYKDFALFGKEIVALRANGELVSIDRKTDRTKKIALDVVAFNKSNEKLFYIDISGKIFFYNLFNHKAKLVGHSEFEVKFIEVIEQEIFLIVPSGIINLETNKIFHFNDAELNNSQVNFDLAPPPSVCESDKRGTIWVGFNFGEWGGELLAFDTKSNNFMLLEKNEFKPELHGVETLCASDSGVLVSFGRGHSWNDGLFEVVGNRVKPVFYPKDSTFHFIHNGKEAVKLVGGRQVGSLSFKSSNNSIYIYSEGQILAGNKGQNLQKIENWRMVVDMIQFQNEKFRVLDTMYSERIYPGLEVLKLAVLQKDTVVFLTRKNGIGYVTKDKIAIYR